MNGFDEVYLGPKVKLAFSISWIELICPYGNSYVDISIWSFVIKQQYWTKEKETCNL